MTRRIRFLFYTAKMPDGEFIDDAISIWTWVLAAVRFAWDTLKYNFSHVEIWFEDLFYGGFERQQGDIIEYIGKCYSSTSRGKYNGTRFIPADELLVHPERWMYIELEIPAFAYDTMMQMAISQLGKLYDFKGLFGFAWIWNIQDLVKWYCSEIINWMANGAKIVNSPSFRISPRRFCGVLVKKYHIEPKKLAA